MIFLVMVAYNKASKAINQSNRKYMSIFLFNYHTAIYNYTNHVQILAKIANAERIQSQIYPI